MSSITLHRELGVNPRLTICPRCGGDGQELVLMGARNYKEVCRECGMVHYGGAERTTRNGTGRCCAKCKSYNLDRVEMTDGEKVIGDFCDKCKAEMQQFDEIFKAGGVAFKCTGCGTHGMIEGGTDTARKVREAHGTEFTTGPYKKCGLEIPSCPNCPEKT